MMGKHSVLKTMFMIFMLSIFSVFIFSTPGLAEEKEIIIGQGAALSGSISAEIDFFKCREDVFEMLNQSGGIRGHKVKMLWADAKYQASEDIKIYKRFADQGIVGYLPGSVGGSEQLKVLGEPYGVPISHPVSSSIMRHPPGMTYPVYPTFGDCTAGTMDWDVKNMWKKSGKPKVAVVTNDTAYGKSVEEAVPYLKSKGIELVFTAYVSPTAVDLSPQLLQADQAGADFILSCPLSESKPLIRDFKRLKLNEKGMKIVCPWAVSLLSTHPGSAQEGSGFVMGPFQVVLPEFEGKYGLPSVEVLKKFQISKYGKIVPSGLYWGVIPGAVVLAEAIGKAIDAVGFDNLKGREVAKQFETLNVPAEKTYGLTPALKATPGKRGMMDKSIVAIAKDGKWDALSGWVDMPNLQDWKEAHPEFYKK